jgi:hypothetical protein
MPSKRGAGAVCTQQHKQPTATTAPPTDPPTKSSLDGSRGQGDEDTRIPDRECEGRMDCRRGREGDEGE